MLPSIIQRVEHDVLKDDPELKKKFIIDLAPKSDEIKTLLDNYKTKKIAATRDDIIEKTILYANAIRQAGNEQQQKAFSEFSNEIERDLLQEDPALRNQLIISLAPKLSEIYQLLDTYHHNKQSTIRDEIIEKTILYANTIAKAGSEHQKYTVLPSIIEKVDRDVLLAHPALRKKTIIALAPKLEEIQKLIVGYQNYGLDTTRDEIIKKTILYANAITKVGSERQKNTDLPGVIATIKREILMTHPEEQERLIAALDDKTLLHTKPSTLQTKPSTDSRPKQVLKYIENWLEEDRLQDEKLQEYKEECARADIPPIAYNEIHMELGIQLESSVKRLETLYKGINTEIERYQKIIGNEGTEEDKAELLALEPRLEKARVHMEHMVYEELDAIAQEKLRNNKYSPKKKGYPGTQAMRKECEARHAIHQMLSQYMASPSDTMKAKIKARISIHKIYFSEVSPNNKLGWPILIADAQRTLGESPEPFRVEINNMLLQYHDDPSIELAEAIKKKAQLDNGRVGAHGEESTERSEDIEQILIQINQEIHTGIINEIVDDLSHHRNQELTESAKNRLIAQTNRCIAVTNKVQMTTKDQGKLYTTISEMEIYLNHRFNVENRAISIKRMDRLQEQYSYYPSSELKNRILKMKDQHDTFYKNTYLVNLSAGGGTYWDSYQTELEKSILETEQRFFANAYQEFSNCWEQYHESRTKENEDRLHLFTENYFNLAHDLGTQEEKQYAKQIVGSVREVTRSFQFSGISPEDELTINKAQIEYAIRLFAEEPSTDAWRTIERRTQEHNDNAEKAKLGELKIQNLDSELISQADRLVPNLYNTINALVKNSPVPLDTHTKTEIKTLAGWLLLATQNLQENDQMRMDAIWYYAHLEKNLKIVIPTTRRRESLLIKRTHIQIDLTDYIKSPNPDKRQTIMTAMKHLNSVAKSYKIQDLTISTQKKLEITENEIFTKTENELEESRRRYTAHRPNEVDKKHIIEQAKWHIERINTYGTEEQKNDIHRLCAEVEVDLNLQGDERFYLKREEQDKFHQVLKEKMLYSIKLYKQNPSLEIRMQIEAIVLDLQKIANEIDKSELKILDFKEHLALEDQNNLPSIEFNIRNAIRALKHSGNKPSANFLVQVRIYKVMVNSIGTSKQKEKTLPKILDDIDKMELERIKKQIKSEPTAPNTSATTLESTISSLVNEYNLIVQRQTDRLGESKIELKKPHNELNAAYLNWLNQRKKDINTKLKSSGEGNVTVTEQSTIDIIGDTHRYIKEVDDHGTTRQTLKLPDFVAKIEKAIGCQFKVESDLRERINAAKNPRSFRITTGRKKTTSRAHPK